VIKAKLLPEPAEEQGSDWTVYPLQYLSAALYLADVEGKDIERVARFMRELVDEEVRKVATRVAEASGAKNAGGRFVSKLKELGILR